MTCPARATAARGWLAAAVCVALCSLARHAVAQPETLGPYQVERWTDPPGTAVPCPAGVFYATDAPCAGAPVVLVHGGGENGNFKVRMAELMASRGLVAIVPSFPSLLVVPTAAEGAQINELLDWAVQQSQEASSPLYGRVDDTAYGVAGHSNGGVAYIAAAANPKITAIIGWDAVAHLSAAAGFHGASLHLLADGVHCGGGSREAYDLAPEPKVLATVTDSSHCDFNDPASPLCVPFCGTPPWNAQAAAMIERYSVAWFTCLLGHDPTMVAHLDFTSSLPGLESAEQVGSFTCQSASCGSGAAGGSAGAGTGAGQPLGGGGAGGSSPAGGTSAAGHGGSAGASWPVAPTSDEDAGGCGCQLPGSPQPRGATLWLLVGLVLGAARPGRRPSRREAVW